MTRKRQIIMKTMMNQNIEPMTPSDIEMMISKLSKHVSQHRARLFPLLSFSLADDILPTRTHLSFR